jgi:hypothetical protein
MGPHEVRWGEVKNTQGAASAGGLDEGIQEAPTVMRRGTYGGEYNSCGLGWWKVREL